MEAGERSEEFIRAGLATLGVEADEVELAVIGAAHAIFWPSILGLLELDTDERAPEHNPDFSRAPRR